MAQYAKQISVGQRSSVVEQSFHKAKVAGPIPAAGTIGNSKFKNQSAKLLSFVS